MSLNETLKEKTIQRVDHFVALAEEIYGITVGRPVINFEVRGGDAGRASPDLFEVDFNAVLLVANEQAFMDDTIPHEVAHLICYKLHGWIKRGRGISHHGVEWKKIMRDFGCVPSTCHNLDVSKVKRKMREFLYSCPDCEKTFPISIIRHNKMARGKTYSHCQESIQFIKEIV